MNWWELIAFLVQFACDMEMILFPKDYLVQVFGPGVMEGYDEAVLLHYTMMRGERNRRAVPRRSLAY